MSAEKLLPRECGVNGFAPSLQVGTQSLSGVSLNLLKGRNIQVLWNAALHYRGGEKTDICVVLPLNGPELFGNVNYMAQRIAVSHCIYIQNICCYHPTVRFSRFG